MRGKSYAGKVIPQRILNNASKTRQSSLKLISYPDLPRPGGREILTFSASDRGRSGYEISLKREDPFLLNVVPLQVHLRLQLTRKFEVSLILGLVWFKTIEAHRQLLLK